MSETSIRQLKNFEGREVLLRGWVYQFRSSGKISFLALRDGTGDCQCVFTEGTASSEALESFSELSLETTVEVRGQVKKWKDSFELQGRDLKILFSAAPWPLGKKSHGVDFLMSRRHLWLRSKKQRAIMSVRNELIQNIHRFFQKEGFLHIDAPVLAAHACEGTSSLFSVNFFDQDSVYLSQSGQMYMEAAAAAYGKVYCFGPTFRAEKSSTPPSSSGVLDDGAGNRLLQSGRGYGSDGTAYGVCGSKHSSDKGGGAKGFGKKPGFPQGDPRPFSPVFPTGRPVRFFRKTTGTFSPEGISEGVRKPGSALNIKKPVFIHHYPKNIKAFYMKEDEKDPSLSLSFDLLATDGYGELIGGGQREDSLEKLERGIREHNLKLSDFDWLFGSAPFREFSSLRFRVGPGAFDGLGLRTGACEGNHPLSQSLWPILF